MPTAPAPQWKRFDQFDTLIVAKNDRPVVKFVIMLPFGAYLDPKGQEGLTNITGDMLLRGCSTYTREALENLLDQLGASMSIYCGFHTVSIEGQILKRNYPKLLTILEEVLKTPDFDPTQCSELIKETQDQIKLRQNDDQSLARYAFVKELYKGHLYEQDVVGSIQSLSTITAKDCQEHFKNYFSMKDAWICLSGDVNPTMVELTGLTLKRALPETAHKAIPSRDSQNPEPLTGKKLILVDKPGRSQTHFYIGHPTQQVTHPAYFDFSVYSTAFAGGNFQAKYMQEIRVKRGWSYGAYGSMDQRKEASSYYLYTFPKNEDTADAIALSLDLYDQAMQGSLIEPADIEFTKNYLYRSFPFKIDTPNKVLSQKIHQRLLGLPEDYLQNYRDRIDAVSDQGIIDRIRPFFSAQDKVITVLGTASEIQASLEDKVKDFEIEVIPYTDLIT